MSTNPLPSAGTAKSPARSPARLSDEQILVVSTQRLYASFGQWNGIKNVDERTFATFVVQEGLFVARAPAEQDPLLKQIIPYLVFQHDGALFLMRRTSKSREQRLHDRYTLGIGGHIRQEDIKNHDIFAWADREFHEEICYEGSFTTRLLGVINDDSDEVGTVHVGCVYLLMGGSSAIAIRDELAWGALTPLNECIVFRDRMESWSRLVLDFLLTQKPPISTPGHFCS